MRPIVIFGTIVASLLFAGIALAQPAPQDWENWLTDFSKHSVPLDEIFSGGPPKDGIPSISNPKFVSADMVESVADNEPVIGLKVGKDARAYPLSVLMWHEIVNDVVGDKPVVVTYCPLCNSSIVFDGEVEGKRMMFGTTGRLRNSDMVMYDRRTESWWQQFSGEAIVGKLTGTKLKTIPSRLESFASFKQRFPKGKVLVPREPGLRKYGENPYVGYDSLAKPFLFDGTLPKEIKPMKYVVVATRPDKVPLVVTLEKLRAEGSLSVDGIELTWKEGMSSALDTPKIAMGRELGNVIAMDEKSNADLPYDVTFAFVAHAFHPDAPVHTVNGKIGGLPEVPQSVDTQATEPEAPSDKKSPGKPDEVDDEAAKADTEPASNDQDLVKEKDSDEIEEAQPEPLDNVVKTDVTEAEAKKTEVEPVAEAKTDKNAETAEPKKANTPIPTASPRKSGEGQ